MRDLIAILKALGQIAIMLVIMALMLSIGLVVWWLCVHTALLIPAPWEW